jgi:hypothetical protein
MINDRPLDNPDGWLTLTRTCIVRPLFFLKSRTRIVNVCDILAYTGPV